MTDIDLHMVCNTSLNNYFWFYQFFIVSISFIPICIMLNEYVEPVLNNLYQELPTSGVVYFVPRPSENYVKLVTCG